MSESIADFTLKYYKTLYFKFKLCGQLMFASALAKQLSHKNKILAESPNAEQKTARCITTFLSKNASEEK